MSSRQEEEVEEKPKISFKKVKGKSFRRRRESDDEEEPSPGEEESLLWELSILFCILWLLA